MTPNLTPDKLKEIEERNNAGTTRGAMNSACGEYNCQCHYDIPLLLAAIRERDEEITLLRRVEEFLDNNKFAFLDEIDTANAHDVLTRLALWRKAKAASRESGDGAKNG